jgi:hypothetical protein
MYSARTIRGWSGKYRLAQDADQANSGDETAVNDENYDKNEAETLCKIVFASVAD